jgi:hypothetical protein
MILEIQWELWEVREDIPHWLTGGKDRAVRDGVNASMQSSREHCSMSAQIVE